MDEREKFEAAWLVERGADDLEARVRWLYNPLPVGSYLYESQADADARGVKGPEHG